MTTMSYLWGKNQQTEKVTENISCTTFRTLYNAAPRLSERVANKMRTII